MLIDGAGVQEETRSNVGRVVKGAVCKRAQQPNPQRRDDCLDSAHSTPFNH